MKRSPRRLATLVAMTAFLAGVAAPQAGSTGGIDATITALTPAPLRPGGDPLDFTVALANATSADIADVGLVVSMGHCSCEPSGGRMMPAGSMRLLESDTRSWMDVPYVREGGGTDYLSRTVVPPFVLKQGATNTYQFQVRLDSNANITAGDGTIDVTVRTPAGSGTQAALPVTVEP